MIQSRNLRRLVISTLVVMALALLPVSPATALPVDGWTFQSVPAAWNFVWKLVARVWEDRGTRREDRGAAQLDGATTTPQTPPPQIGSSIDPDG